jgi:hypothetical protein
MNNSFILFILSKSVLKWENNDVKIMMKMLISWSDLDQWHEVHLSSEQVSWIV